MKYELLVICMNHATEHFKWFNSQYDGLKKEYNGQYVAFQEQQILDSDTNLERLIK
jgi:hypothetical protein